MAVRTAATSSGGAQTHPIFHPVNENVLPPDEMVTVRVPTTVLWGERDRALLPGLLGGLERWVPQLDVRRVPDASHWLVHEQPRRVADEILRLLA